MESWSFDIFADFTVRILSEDDSVMATAKASCLSMKLWRAEGLTARPPNKAVTHPPDTKRKNDQDGVFYFRWAQIYEVKALNEYQGILSQSFWYFCQGRLGTDYSIY